MYDIYRYYNEDPSEFLSKAFYTAFGIGEPLLILVSAILLTLLSIQRRGDKRQKMCSGYCCKQRQYVDLDDNESQNETNPSSHPIYQPSHTYFSIPYTGQFTQVSGIEHNTE